VRWDKSEFIGLDQLRRAKEAGVGRRLLGLVLEGDRIARAGSEVRAAGNAIGRVTSGSMGITVGRPVAMAYLSADAAKPGARVDVMTRGEPTPALVTSRPIYKHGSIKSPKPRRAE
jgi:aminomethyltransferase